MEGVYQTGVLQEVWIVEVQTSVVELQNMTVAGTAEGVACHTGEVDISG